MKEVGEEERKGGGTESGVKRWSARMGCVPDMFHVSFDHPHVIPL